MKIIEIDLYVSTLTNDIFKFTNTCAHGHLKYYKTCSLASKWVEIAAGTDAVYSLQDIRAENTQALEAEGFDVEAISQITDMIWDTFWSIRLERLDGEKTAAPYSGEPLTASQITALRVMGERTDQQIVNYGSGFNVKRASVMRLAALGLALYMPTKHGVCCRITDAGRQYLRGA